MHDEKVKRIAVSLTVAGVVLAVMLIFVLLYQLVSITILKNRKEKLKNEIAYYQQIIDTTEDEIEKHSAAWFIEMKAREYGMLFEDDIKFVD